jgi:hypothetical protein
MLIEEQLQGLRRTGDGEEKILDWRKRNPIAGLPKLREHAFKNYSSIRIR